MGNKGKCIKILFRVSTTQTDFMQVFIDFNVLGFPKIKIL